MKKIIELNFTDEQIANFPSYSWPLQCCWCGSGMGAQVRAAEVNGIKFSCQMCGKPNYVQRRGNRVLISSTSIFRAGCLLLMIAIVIGILFIFIPFKLPSFHLPSFSIYNKPEFITRILPWVGYIAAFAILVSIPIQINRWRTVKKLYGHIPYRLAWQIGIYCKKNRMLRIQLWLLFLMLSFLVSWFVNWIGSYFFDFFHLFDDKTYSHFITVIMVSIWMTMRVIKFLTPPTALLLGTAKSVNIHLVAILNQSLRPYRIVSLLDLKKEHIFPAFVKDVMYNNLRTVNGYEWRTVVHHLMDVVPIIIVDDAVSTEYVDDEMNRIKRFGYEYKVVSFSSADYGWEINAIQSGIGAVVNAAKKLGEELVNKIQPFLLIPIDTRQRMKAQEYYNLMIKKVPWRVRFKSDINAMLIKAHYILAWTMENYIKDCKQNVQGDISAWLLEDIPLKVSIEEDENYIKRSRGLDEVRGVSTSALQLAIQSSDPLQLFNIANAHHKIGKCARYSREWDDALKHLTKAIEMFSQMSDGVIIDHLNEKQIQDELTNAFFHRGEVYMALFRETESQSDRENAVYDFNVSMRIDQKFGWDSTITSCRIKSLNKIIEVES
jgi:tetratricopeptide (TPR) repeat protein